jgi:hypothetical protein
MVSSRNVINKEKDQEEEHATRMVEADLALLLWRSEIFGYTISRGEQEPWARFKKPTLSSLSEMRCD